MKVLIADNHTLFREGVRSQLQRFNSLSELQEITNFETLSSLAARKKTYDLIFVDRGLLGAKWRENFKAVISMFPEARVVMLSDSEDPKEILETYDIGAVGFITKRSPDTLTISALRQIMDGNSYVPPAVLKGMHRQEREAKDGRLITLSLPDGKSLTARQGEVLQHLSNGLSNKQIAYEMKVSEATVKLHINALLRHLHVENRTKAVVTAQRMGILEA